MNTVPVYFSTQFTLKKVADGKQNLCVCTQEWMVFRRDEQLQKASVEQQQQQQRKQYHEKRRKSRKGRVAGMQPLSAKKEPQGPSLRPQLLPFQQSGRHYAQPHFQLRQTWGKAPEKPPNPKPQWNTIKGVPGASPGKPGKKPIEN